MAGGADNEGRESAPRRLQGQTAERLKTRLTLRPGQNGTKKLQRKYGERLLAVRYRYDPVRRVRLKTVELVEEELPWPSPAPTAAPDLRPVLVRVDYDEVALQRAVKAAGGLWQKDRQLWLLPRRLVAVLHLQHRVVAK